MRAALMYVRTTLSFLSGAVVLAAAFIVAMTTAVLHANVSHGAPVGPDYAFAIVVLAVLTLGFAGGLVAFRDVTTPPIPSRTAAITGAGAVALLMIIMMLAGEALQESGSTAVGFVDGTLAAVVSLRPWRSSVLRSSVAL